MVFSVFFLALVLLLILFAVGEWIYWNLTKKAPGPWGVPVLYFIPFMYWANAVASNQISLFESLAKKYGKVFCVRLPGFSGTYYFDTHPADVDFVLQTNFDNFPKAAFIHTNCKELFGNGIFSVDGHQWLLQRKAASNAFRVNDIKHNIQVFKRAIGEV